MSAKKYKESKRKRFPDAAEAVRFLVALEAMRKERPYFVALVELLLFTGARLREIMHAEWAWVKPDAGGAVNKANRRHSPVRRSRAGMPSRDRG